MRTFLKEWRPIKGHSVKQPFYEHSVCKWGEVAPPQPRFNQWRAINGHSFQRAFCWQVRWAPPFVFFAMQACFQQRCAMLSRFLQSETESETSTASRDECAKHVFHATIRCFLICAWPSLVGVFGGGRNNSSTQIARPERFHWRDSASTSRM